MAKSAKPDRIRWEERKSPVENARRELPPLVSAYFAAGRKLLADEPVPGDLHALRLATKRLRYTLELFRTCYGPGLDARLAELRKVQQLLGEINDHVAAANLLSTLSGRRAEQRRAAATLNRGAETKARAFQKFWAESFDSPGRESWWTTYFARSARAPARRAPPSRR